MASPFRVFRKYQKTLLAIAGVVLMFVFVVGDSLVSYLSGSKNARAGDEHNARSTAVHWDGGKLTNQQLNDLVMRRRILNNFLKQVEMEGRRPSFEAGVDPPELRVQSLLGPETPQQQVESSVVKTKLLADAASDSGMKVSDETLLQYLDELGRKNVSREKMRAMLSSTQNRVSIDYVIDALREEMLAHNYRIIHEFAFETVTPQQRWKDWLRVNDRIVIEAAAVPAEMYLADVKDPTEAELTTFFEKYKDQEARIANYGNADMPLPTPGFKIPRKIDLQFVQASYDEFLTKAEAKVTDEEVAKYYDEHKDLFPKTDTGLMDDKGQKKDATKPDAPANKADAKEGASGAKPADTEKKAAEPAAKETKSSEKKAAAPAPKEGQPEDKASDGKKSSYLLHPSKSVFRLTAFAEDVAKKDSKADKADTPADAKAEKATEKPNEKAAEKSTLDAKASPADKPAAPLPVVIPPAGTPDASKAAPATPPAAAPKKPVEYQPLSEVKDEIRRRLAEGKVNEQLSNLTGDIQNQLDSEFNRWFNEALAAQSDKKEPPAPPKSLTDLAPIAQKNGLKDVRSGPKSRRELFDLPVGKSSATDANRGLLSMLFDGHDLDLYQPVSTHDIDGNRFVVMKMSDTPARVPTLAEVKDEVVKEWKRQQAAELAQKHADELAKKAQEAKTPLTNFFADNKSIKVVRTDPFSELTGGDVSLVGGQIQQQPYRFSQPSEIVFAGPDFLRRIFDLKDGQVAVIPNNDHSITYIVRIVDHQPGLPELRNNYLAEAYSWYGENIMNQMHRQEVDGNFETEVEVRSNLKWDRAADSAKGDQRDEG